MIIEEGFKIYNKTDLSNEFIKSSFIQNSIQIFENKIVQIASEEQTEESNICTEDFIKSILYLSVLKKSTQSKFEKQNYLAMNINISVSQEYYDEYCVEEIEQKKGKAKKVTLPHVSQFSGEWKKYVKVDKKQKDKILINTELTAQNKDKSESLPFQLNSSPVIIVSSSQYYSQSSEFPQVVVQQILRRQERLKTEIKKTDNESN